MTPLPPMASDALLILLVQLACLLLLALLLGRLAVKVGMPAIVGELTSGVLLGPSLFGHVAPGAYQVIFPAAAEQMHLLDAVGQVGVLLLVGITGAHVDMRMACRRSATAARISLGGLVIPLGAGLLVGFLAPASFAPREHDRLVFALFLAMAMSVTAIPVIAKTLADMKLLHRDVGQLTLTAAMIDDAVAWLLLSVVSVMATSGLQAEHLGTSILALFVVVLLAGFVGRPIVRRIMAWAGRSAEAGPTVATTVVVILTFAAITCALGMEAVFGAFVAGVLIGLPNTTDPIQLGPLRIVVMTVLAPVFLATAGLRMDLTILADPKVLLAAVVVLAIAMVGKFSGVYLGVRASRMGHWEGVALGSAMNARGMVELVVASVGLRLGVLDVTTYTMVALMAIVTSVMTPPCLRFAMARVGHTEEETLRSAELELLKTGRPASTSP